MSDIGNQLLTALSMKRIRFEAAVQAYEALSVDERREMLGTWLAEEEQRATRGGRGEKGESLPITARFDAEKRTQDVVAKIKNAAPKKSRFFKISKPDSRPESFLDEIQGLGQVDKIIAALKAARGVAMTTSEIGATIKVTRRQVQAVIGKAVRRAKAAGHEVIVTELPGTPGPASTYAIAP